MTQETQAIKPIEKIIAEELSVTPHQVWSAVKLLDSGSTVPFIARYRKEATGGLSDTHLRMLSERLDYLREMERRRMDVLDVITKQGKLTPALREALENAQTKSELEDLYLPYRPQKRTRAGVARDSGLEPLANALVSDPLKDPAAEAQKFVSPLKSIPDANAALSGARDILIERFALEAPLLSRLRKRFWEEGWVYSQVLHRDLDPKERFADYYQFRQELTKIPSHRMLAILRGRKEKILKLTFETSGYRDYAAETDMIGYAYIALIAEHFGIQKKNRPADQWLADTVRQAWSQRIRIYLEMDILGQLSERAEDEAIRVFADNLRSLLLQAPAGPRAIMGIDPGFRTGAKVVCVDRTAKVLKTVTIFPHPPQNEWELSQEVLTLMIKMFAVEIIAIGNGTASRETDRLVTSVIKRLPDKKIQKVLTSEAGASVYSASELASRELPDMDVSMRGAVSIARRLQDPLAELVKIDPKAIGVGQYQHDVNQYKLSRSLRNVVEDCVNAVGVDVNTASPSLLAYVSGLNARSAESIVQHRSKYGSFQNRQDFLKIADFGPRTFEQAAGFLRIHNGNNPLDASAVHPESYVIIEKIVARTGQDVSHLIGNVDAIRHLQARDYIDEQFGEPTILDILRELEKPGRDPRPQFQTATFRDEVESVEDLKVGMKLEGVVTNVANFGAFVDIGVHQDGLLHISEISDTEFVTNPREHLQTGQIVHVRVVAVEASRNRIALSMRRSSNTRKI